MSLKQIATLPCTDSPSGWNALLPKREAMAALSAAETANWPIIGGGLAGLAAARRLAEQAPQARIAVLEAHVIGENASGKNSGFAIDLPHHSDNNVAGTAAAQAEIQLFRRTLEQLEALVQTHHIDCD